jgi:hypothetical protein
VKVLRDNRRKNPSFFFPNRVQGGASKTRAG